MEIDTRKDNLNGICQIEKRKHCVICLCNEIPPNIPVGKLKCNHNFCYKCIYEWA